MGICVLRRKGVSGEKRERRSQRVIAIIIWGYIPTKKIIWGCTGQDDEEEQQQQKKERTSAITTSLGLISSFSWRIPTLILFFFLLYSNSYLLFICHADTNGYIWMGVLLLMFFIFHLI